MKDASQKAPGRAIKLNAETLRALEDPDTRNNQSVVTSLNCTLGCTSHCGTIHLCPQ